MIFEKSSKHTLKLIGKIRLSEKFLSIKSLTFNPKEDLLAITAICPYSIEELTTSEDDPTEVPSKLANPSKPKDSTKKQYTFLFTHKKEVTSKKVCLIKTFDYRHNFALTL